jgi:hypothetical protein
MSANVPFIAPNSVTNTYHLVSLLGGYGVWSTGQLLQVDMIKTQIGGKFNYREVIDKDPDAMTQKTGKLCAKA